MKKISLEFFVVILVLSIFSFILNFVWETLHSAYLYDDHWLPANRYVPMVFLASIVDSLLIAGLYLAIGAGARDFLWIREITGTKILGFLAAGLAVAAFVEYRAVYIISKWSYSESMPTVLGIGLSPLVQLSLSGLLALWLTRRLLYGRCL
jgi:hypothetical protein